jgi:hypothetical protein
VVPPGLKFTNWRIHFIREGPNNVHPEGKAPIGPKNVHPEGQLGHIPLPETLRYIPLGEGHFSNWSQLPVLTLLEALH